MHPYFKNPYQLRVFLNISPKDQMENIKKRNGPEKAKQFQNMWIPKEEAYFKKFHVMDGAIQVMWNLKTENKRLFYQRNLKMICFSFPDSSVRIPCLCAKYHHPGEKCRNRSRAPDRETEPFLRPVSKLQGIQNQDNIRKHLFL